MLLGSECKLVMLSTTRLSPSRVQHSPPLRLAAWRLYCSPTTLFSRFRLLPFRSLLLRKSLLLSFPLATKMFQFARLSLACPWIHVEIRALWIYCELNLILDDLCVLNDIISKREVIELEIENEDKGSKSNAGSDKYKSKRTISANSRLGLLQMISEPSIKRCV